MATTMKIPSRELWSYFGYGLGQCFSFGLVGSFINYFYTDVLGISALAASTIFLIARAWDAVHDPLFASIMDTINSRFGKFRHFLLIAPLLITGVTLLSFYKIEADMTTKILYAGVTYILWGTLYAISDIPFWSMSSVMTNDSGQRTRAVTAAMLGVNAGIACANIFFPKLAAYFAQYSNDKGYFMAALVMMLVGLPLMLNGFMQIKERVPPSPEKPADGDWRDGDYRGGAVSGRPDADAADAEAEAVYDPLRAGRGGARGDVVCRLSAGDDAVHSARPEHAVRDDDQHSHLVDDCRHHRVRGVPHPQALRGDHLLWADLYRQDVGGGRRRVDRRVSDDDWLRAAGANPERRRAVGAVLRDLPAASDRVADPNGLYVALYLHRGEARGDLSAAGGASARHGAG
ncbi:hypothetical protein L1887_42809 [Cichorium endivia]|nr:hypothetical protein L1887_42809 [Cichorium endivia]